jgi:hypothetical protein
MIFGYARVPADGKSVAAQVLKSLAICRDVGYIFI